MAVAKVVTRGNHALAASLRRLGRNLESPTVANRQAGQIIVRHARVFCPVKTGRLQGSIHIKDTRGKGVTVVASEGIVYGPVQHWGWPAHHIRATLFMTRGLEAAGPECIRMYTQQVQRDVSEVHGA